MRTHTGRPHDVRRVGSYENVPCLHCCAAVAAFAACAVFLLLFFFFAAFFLARDFCDLPKPIKRYPPPPHPLKGRRPSTEPHEFFQRPLVWLNLPRNLPEAALQAGPWKSRATVVLENSRFGENGKILRSENPKTSPENLINTFCGAP